LTINPKFDGTRGYTLVEMMIVLVVMGVMISFGIPQFSRALEQARADVAGANLRAIWTAERIYWLDNRTYTTSLPGLVSLNLLDPSIPPDPSYSYQVQVPAEDGTPFTATAQRTGSGSWSGTLTITQDGGLTGTLTCTNQANIVVGFQ
jgi:prepilin-type N-terminal cleavage/methylation domain-containing protein